MMIKCKECKREIAHTAKACPHCGAADPAMTFGLKVLNFFLLIGLLCLAAFGVVSCISA